MPGTGYRKEITSCQVGLRTFIGNTLSGYLLKFSSGNVCWHRPGSHLNVAGLSLKFQVVRYEIRRGELTCENCHFSSFLTAGNVVQGRTSATQWQKFHTDDINNVYIINLVQSLGSKWKFVQFDISPGRFWSSVVFIWQWAPTKVKCF